MTPLRVTSRSLNGRPHSLSAYLRSAPEVASRTFFISACSGRSLWSGSPMNILSASSCTSIPYCIPLLQNSSQSSEASHPSPVLRRRISWTPSFFLLGLYPVTSGLSATGCMLASGGIVTSFMLDPSPLSMPFMKDEGRPDMTVTYCLARDIATNIRRLSSL